MKQGSLSSPERKVFATEIEQMLHSMESALTKDALKPEVPVLAPVLAKLRRDFVRVNSKSYRAKPLAKLSSVQRRAYEQAFALLYECSTDKGLAKLLVDRMLAQLAKDHRKRKIVSR